MQQSLIDSNIIQSTTVKTIKELKKLGDSRTNLEADENEVNDSTLSGKNTPEDETSKTQNTKATLNKKPKLTFKLQTQNRITSMKQAVVKTTDDMAEQSNGLRKASLRQGSLRLQRPQPQLQLESNDPVDMNNALNLILTKCKTIKEEFEQLQLTNTLINKYIKNDKHFHFSFQAFLDNLVSKGKLTQTLTNIQKPVLQRIELFTPQIVQYSKSNNLQCQNFYIFSVQQIMLKDAYKKIKYLNNLKKKLSMLTFFSIGITESQQILNKISNISDLIDQICILVFKECQKNSRYEISPHILILIFSDSKIRFSNLRNNWNFNGNFCKTPKRKHYLKYNKIQILEIIISVLDFSNYIEYTRQFYIIQKQIDKLTGQVKWFYNSFEFENNGVCKYLLMFKYTQEMTLCIKQIRINMLFPTLWWQNKDKKFTKQRSKMIQN